MRLSSREVGKLVRIVYLHQYFNTPAMAGGTRSYEMARRLVTAGHQVDMVTSDREPPAGWASGWRTTTEAGVRVHWTPVRYSNRLGYRARIRSFVGFAWRAASKAASLPADVVFATSTPLTIALPAVYAARRRRIPMVFEVRDLWPELPIAIGALRSPLTRQAARWLERFAYRNAARIVALSPGMKEGIVGAGYPAVRVSVIPNAADREEFGVGAEVGEGLRRSLDWLGDRPLVGYLGTLGMINGVDYLVRTAAYARVLDPDIRFAIVGDGQREDQVRELAVGLGVLNANLRMLPGIPKRDVPAWLSATTVATSLFVDLPQMQANSANKFFDALAAGRPIAVNYGGWHADLIRESGAGLALPPGDHAQAAAMLCSAARDPTWIANARSASARLAHERFERSALAAQLEQVLREVAGRPAHDGVGPGR